MEIKKKTILLNHLTRSAPIEHLKRKDMATIVKKISSETDLVVSQIELESFERVAALLFFVLDTVWIQMITPSSPQAGNLKRRFLRLPFNGEPLDLTKKGRLLKGPKHVFEPQDVLEGIWCLIDLPPGLKAGDRFTLNVGAIQASGVCAPDYGGQLELQVVLGPLMEHTRSEWMVPMAWARDEFEEESDILESAKKHADFFKEDLYVTQHAIIKFLDVELKIPRKGMLGRKYFVTSVQALRARLATQGYRAKSKKDAARVAVANTAAKQ